MAIADVDVDKGYVVAAVPFAGPPACEYGPSGHCANGAHKACAHRRGGLQEHGSWSPECYVSIGGKPTSLVSTGPGWQVIRPSHVWRCSCDCHSAPPEPEQGMLW